MTVDMEVKVKKRKIAVWALAEGGISSRGFYHSKELGEKTAVSARGKGIELGSLEGL
jgi:hypothetical protein